MIRIFTLALCAQLLTSFAVSGQTAVPELKGMALVHGGTFTMGDLFDNKADAPPHEVTLSDFYIGKTEVTFEQYDAFCTATNRDKPPDFRAGRSQFPVVNISWYNAVEYCNWLSLQQHLTPVYIVDKTKKDPDNTQKYDYAKWTVIRKPDANGYRLPTEAEWEYAARAVVSPSGVVQGGGKVRFGNGKAVADSTQMNFKTAAMVKWGGVGYNGMKMVEVGSLHNANPLGLHDMSGNVWEWCADWYGPYATSAQTDPLGASKGEDRISRGGDFQSPEEYCTTAIRGHSDPSVSISNNGFRLAANGPGIKSTTKLPDRDKDGIADAEDQCPDRPGTVEGEGCPVQVMKDQDEEPVVATNYRDPDGDGVEEGDDHCPDQAGIADNYGCPPKIRYNKKPLIPDAKTIIAASSKPAPPGLVFVKGATFTMGDISNESEYNDEIPHTVTVSDFYIGKMEVTFEEFDSFCIATGRNLADDVRWGRQDYPVINVSWYDAVEYCNWLSRQQGKTPVYRIDKKRKDAGNHDANDKEKWTVTRIPGAKGYRLPTEAEWEYAAREGGQKVRFGNGKNQADPDRINSRPAPQANGVHKEARFKTIRVGYMQSPNALGLHEMSGNVWEWCADWYGKYPTTPQTNPTGPASGPHRVFRGGSWASEARACRVSNRGEHLYTANSFEMGFRLVLPAE